MVSLYGVLIHPSAFLSADICMLMPVCWQAESAAYSDEWSALWLEVLL